MQGYRWEPPPIPTTRKQHQLTLLGIGTTGLQIVDHLYKMGIKDTRFIICHADKSLLWSSPVPNKLLYEAEPEYEHAEQNLMENLEVALKSSEVTIVVTDLSDFIDCHLADSVMRVLTELNEFSLVAVGLPAITDPPLCEQVDQIMSNLQRQANSLLVYEQKQMDSEQRVWQLAEAIFRLTEFCQGFIDEDFDALHKSIKSPGRIAITAGKGIGYQRVHKAVDEVVAQLIDQSFDRNRTKELMLIMSCNSRSPVLVHEHTELMKQLINFIGTEPAVVKQGYITDSRLGEWLAINVLLWMPYTVEQLAAGRSRDFPGT
jgi:cell division GTPase FtsZ